MRADLVNLGYLPDVYRWAVCVSLPYTLKWEIIGCYIEQSDAEDDAYAWAVERPDGVYGVADLHLDAWVLTVYSESSCDIGSVLVTTRNRDYPDGGDLVD
ncbi:MAG: hypothetical protein JXM75_13460 [Chromatiaceae bacterium]|nr:hypothetical protein [Chromatiaceae bacterium]